MMTPPLFHYTISSKELRPDMPSVPFLLSAASFLRQDSKGRCSLRQPRYLPASPWKGADCGGFTATLKWGGHYRFTPAQYVRWLSTWQPKWAATMDLVCLSENGDYPGAAVVKERQCWTTEMARLFWEHYRQISWSCTWTPTIQGYTIEEYERHAQELAPLIWEMSRYYSDPGWWNDDDEEGSFGNTFRVGIGSLCRRPATFILDVVSRVRTILGSLIPLHIWGAKLRVLQAGIAFPGFVSCDSGAWNGLFGLEHEARRASGLTVTEYSWQVSYPDYAQKIARAQQKPQQFALDFDPSPARPELDLSPYGFASGDSDDEIPDNDPLSARS